MKVKQKKFIYNSSKVDQQVKEAVIKALKVKVVSVQRTKQGEISYVFKVVTEKGTLLFKAFKFKGWPDVESLKRVSKLLSRYKIIHPTILFDVKSTAIFPNGFLIQKFIEGEDCHNAILSGRISFFRYHYLIGKFLKKVNQIKFEKFGRLSKPLPKGTNYLDIQSQHLIKHLSAFSGTKLLSKNIQDKLFSKIKTILKDVTPKIEPVLTHGDATPDNCILTPRGELILIDWDNSKASFWLEDLAWLTYCGSHMTSLDSLDKRAKIIRRAFLKGYGRINIIAKDLKKIEYCLHLFKAVSHLGYHYYAQNDKLAFRKTLIKLESLLNEY